MIHFILAGLAGARLAMLLVREEGPFAVFSRVRTLAGVPDIGMQKPKPFIGGVLSCVLCSSVWATGACYAFGALVGWQPIAVVAAMGLAMFTLKKD